MNILMCGYKEHTKPSLDHMADLLHQMIGYDKGNKGGLVLSCMGLPCPNPLVSQISKSRTPTLEIDGQTYFDTVTGETKPVIPEKNVSNPGHHAFQVMQKLKLGDMECLVMYDNGSNANMVQGSVAEVLDLQVVDQSESAVSGIADVEVGTCGAYKLTLGLTQEGCSHEIIAQGAPQITARIPKYDLKEINQEVRASGLLPEETRLPPSVGGTQVRLLLGIEDVRLQPKFLFELDSGIAVYRSPFTDVYGTDLCYGGSHASISRQSPVTNLYLPVNILNMDGQPGGAQSTYTAQPPSGPGHLDRAIVPTLQQDVDQTLVGSQVGRVQDRQVVHPFPTYTLPNKADITFMLMTVSFILMIQIMDTSGFYWSDQSSMEGLTHQLLSNQLMTSLLELSYRLNPNLVIGAMLIRSIHWEQVFSLMFQMIGCAIAVAFPRSAWDYGRRHCAASRLNRVLCRVLRVAKPCMDDNPQTLQ